MNVEAEISEMKALLNVATDEALGLRLRIGRTNVSLWRRRGNVSASAKRRAELIARHHPVTDDSFNRVAADFAALNDRLRLARLPLDQAAIMLEEMAARLRQLGRAQ